MSVATSPQKPKGWKRPLMVDVFRSIPVGIIETSQTTFAILIAVQFYQASQDQKIWLQLGSPAGLLLGLFAVPMIQRLSWSINRGIALLWGISSVGFLMGWWLQDSSWCFAFANFFGILGLTLSIPFLSQLYRDFYPAHLRGRLFSISAMLKKATAIIFALWMGKYLDQHMENASVTMLIYAGCGALMVLAAFLYPKSYLENKPKAPLFKAFRHLKTDREFRMLIISWLFLGLGNLMAMALFVEFISNPRYGHAYSPNLVAQITTIIPEAVFMLTVFAWGVLFDKLNFYLLRALINIVFAVAVIMYFLSGGEYWWLMIGIGLHGFAKAGGNVAWSLWVTKFSKPQYVAEYMSVHTFFTGLRATIAPIVAMNAAGMGMPVQVGLVGGGLMIFATLFLIPEIRLLARRKGHTESPDPR